MAKLSSTFLNMILVLTGISAVAAGLLGGINELTQSTIEQGKQQKQAEAIQAVVPQGYTNDPVADVYSIQDETGRSLPVFPAKKGDELIGVAIETYSPKGFSGEIKVMVGFDQKGAIVNYAVLEHQETPGLGTKMVDWFKTSKNKQSVIGVVVPREGLKVAKEGGEVDAITASTITSKAFLDAVNRANSSYMGNYDGVTSATEQ